MCTKGAGLTSTAQILYALTNMAGLKDERTFLMVKPDGVRRGLTGEIIRRVEQCGLKIVALQMMQATHAQMHDHYPKDDGWVKRLGEKTLSTYEKYGMDPVKEQGTADPFEIGTQVRKWLVEFMTSSPVVKMIAQGPHAVDIVRKLAGDTLPFRAAVGTIRGDFSVDSPAIANAEKRPVLNLVHASETPEEASHEIAHWFTDEEILVL